MASLTLLGIQCYNVVPGQPISVLPFFLDSYIGSSAVTIGDATLVPFGSDASVNITLKSGFIYLVVNNEVILVSDNYIWDNDQATTTYTGFRGFDGGPSPYNIYVSYSLENSLVELFFSTAQGIALKVFFFVRSLWRLVFKPFRKVPPDSIFESDLAKGKSNKDTEIK